MNPIVQAIHDSPQAEVLAYARPRPQWCVMRSDQYDALRADAESDLVPRPEPFRLDHTQVQRFSTTPSFMHVEVIVRAAGADISDLAGTVVDLRGL